MRRIALNSRVVKLRSRCDCSVAISAVKAAVVDVATIQQLAQFGDIALAQHAPRLQVRGQRAIDVDRRMLEPDLRVGTLARVEIQRDRFAAEVLLAVGQFDLRKAMPAVLGGLEDHAAVESRRDGDDFVGLRVVRIAMQLERAAPGLVPFRIEVDDQVQPPMPARAGVVVEVDVVVETLAVAVFMRAAAEIVGVVQQVRECR